MLRLKFWKVSVQILSDGPGVPLRVPGPLPHLQHRLLDRHLLLEVGRRSQRQLSRRLEYQDQFSVGFCYKILNENFELLISIGSRSINTES